MSWNLPPGCTDADVDNAAPQEDPPCGKCGGSGVVSDGGPIVDPCPACEPESRTWFCMVCYEEARGETCPNGHDYFDLPPEPVGRYDAV